MGDRVILHSDINCCYASIEHLHHPELAGKPLAVGGDPEARHGIVLTADYIAKKYGVKTGMALWQAKQVCPDITFVSPRMDLYLRFSRMAHEIYAEYTDRQELYGIDECWLDVTGSSSLKGDGLLIAQEISRRMKSELGITVSVGVSFNKIFAKLGSDYKKPDAITTMYKSEFKQKAWALPVSDLLYVGRSTNQKLAKFGIRTIGDLARADEEVLNSHLGKMGSILWSFANGYDDSPVKLENTHAPIKSVGNSTTTPKDLVCDEDVKIVLYILAESVAARLRENGFRCRVVEISVRDNELFSFTRQKKIDHATNITGEIAAYAYQIFRENYNWSKPIRSVGVCGADLVTDNYWEQIDLFSRFFIQKYLIDKLPLVVGLVVSISLIVYILWFPYKFETSSKGLYGVTTLYRWIPYFGFMLMGAFVGLKTKISTVKKKCRWYDLMLFVVSLGTFYGIQFVAKKHIEVAPFQIITLFPLAGVIYYFYKLCNASWFEKIYSNKYGNVIIMAVSGLCLESYLIQYYLFTDKLNSLFPLNIPLIMLYVLIVSYICRCLARFFSQTFRTEEYEWKKIFEII